MMKLATFGFLSVISFSAMAQPQVITATGSTLDHAIENLEAKAKKQGSKIKKITSAGGKNYIHAGAIVEPLHSVELASSTKKLQ